MRQAPTPPPPHTHTPLQEGRILGLPGSAPHLFTLPRWAGRREPLPPPWTDTKTSHQGVGCGVVHDSSQNCLLALSLGRWREPRSGPLGRKGCLPQVWPHTACPTLQDRFSFFLPPSPLPLFVPLLFACSLKLACGTQGQIHYSFSSMNVPFN